MPDLTGGRAFTVRPLSTNLRSWRLMIELVLGFAVVTCFAVAPGRLSKIALATLVLVWGLGLG